ncbi:MAG: UDP-glucose 4-epimerase [Candidatus Cloacimonetes bacterium HGW-Cloacimonetes-3]|nr:MAG: UDP-glucose 4-epimerase [Candidatus Cloacimonetes bacterium HGW-Cloacimonetes-3]
MLKLLITGITGLVGSNVLRKILELYPELEITALVRPHTVRSRFQEFNPAIRIVELDLGDTSGLKEFLFTNDFDTILHIGAIRGGRKFSKQDYLKSNVYSTEQMVEYCMAKDARLIFCSSVGVFGAIPVELPANNQTEKNPDNYYHYTKIEAEKIINKNILYGLQAAIVRPSITYGKGDHGFPFQLVKMVKRRYFPMINKRVWIHLCHIDALVRVFIWLLDKPWKSGLTLIVADKEPIQLQALVDFISRQVHGKNYSTHLRFDRLFFSLGERIARFLKNELWISRFELISKSWFYNVHPYYDRMETEGYSPHYTIPEFKITIEDYLGK